LPNQGLNLPHILRRFRELFCYLLRRHRDSGKYGHVARTAPTSAR
jgi:hypothetical protein